MSKCNECAFVSGSAVCDVCLQKPKMKTSDAGFPEGLSAWHNVQEFDDTAPLGRYVEQELFNQLSNCLKQRLGCKEVKVWVLMEPEPVYDRSRSNCNTCIKCGNCIVEVRNDKDN